MKVVILAGGKGSRIYDGPQSPPKAMVPIGGYPILWHLVHYLKSCGLGEFIVALGHREEEIRRQIESHRKEWFSETDLQLVDTGPETASAGRIKQLQPHLEQAPFLLAFCDGLCPLNIGDLVDFHRHHEKLATVVAVRPPPRFGYLKMDGDRITKFREKEVSDTAWINGGFFVMEPSVLNQIAGDETRLEQDLLTSLAEQSQLVAFKHNGFWQCMDNIAERNKLEKLWNSGQAPWKAW